MNNFSGFTTFYLSAYQGMDNLMPIYFSIFFVLYITIVSESLVLIGVVYHDKSLHEPMYLLLCNLAVNGLYGSTALLPAMLSNLQSHSHEISLPLCQTQIFAVHTYAITEFTILAAMSYDRYIAICYPLLYHTIMPQRVSKLIVFTWLFPFFGFLLFFIFSLRLKFCERTIEKVYCMNYLLVKLSCTDTSVINIIGLLSVALYTLPQFTMIIYSYANILRICILSFSSSKFKALRTCVPHLLSLINYSIGCFCEIALSRFKTNSLSYHTKLFLSVYFLIFPPILNPVMYGLSIQHIRVHLIKLFSRKKGVGV